MPRFHKHLTVALALFALLGAQVFGLQRGFVCDCGGVARQTSMDHCHGPHSDACHEHEEADADHQHSDQGTEDADTHHHPPYVESVEFAKQDCSSAIPAAVLTAVVDFAWNSLVLLPDSQELPARFAHYDDRSPPECLRVVRTIVMLI